MSSSFPKVIRCLEHYRSSKVSNLIVASHSLKKERKVNNFVALIPNNTLTWLQKSTLEVLSFSVIIACCFRNDRIEFSSSRLALSNRVTVLSSRRPAILAHMPPSTTVVANDIWSIVNPRRGAVSRQVTRKSTVVTPIILDIVFGYRGWSLRCSMRCWE